MSSADAGGAGGGAGGGGGQPGAGLAPRAGGWADLPRDLLETVARAVPAGDRLCFRLVCRRWAAAGAEVKPGTGEEQLQPGRVTRASLMNMTASVARVKMMLGVLKSSPILLKGSKSDTWLPLEGFPILLCRFSAKGGHLAVLKWARAHGCPWDEMTCSGAALNGHLEVLQWPRAHGCPWD